MTVGIVIVSHSAQLANGVAELARQMTQDTVPIADAGGTAEGLGTSVERIMHALRSVDNRDGLLVLLDLGSAILSTEMALEMLIGTLQGQVMLSSAPLVEGAVAAALEAAQGHTLLQVKQEAEKAASKEQLRLLKPLDLTEEEAPMTTPPALSSPSRTTALPTLEQQFTLHNPAGLHARPAALLVQTVGRFQAQVRIQARQREADAHSIMEVLSLGARQGDQITVYATGDDAQLVLDEIEKLIADSFYEIQEKTESEIADVKTKSKPPEVPAQEKQQEHPLWHGLSVSPGIALAPAFFYTTGLPTLSAIPQRSIASTEIGREQERLQQALDEAAQELSALAHQVGQRAANSHAPILDAQALMLRDPALRTSAQQYIAERLIDANGAIALAGEQQAATLAQVDDPLIVARAVDMRDAVARALARLGSQPVTGPDLAALPHPVLLLAYELTPSNMAALDPAIVAGICTVHGGPTDHTAILARASGIPMITGVEEELFQTVQAGDELGLDANQALLYHLPSATVRARLEAHRDEQRRQRESIEKKGAQGYTPIVVQGRHIALLANVASEAEAEAARQHGAGGIGLLRTELLFAGEQSWPDEATRRQRYTRVFRTFYGTGSSQARPVVVRTLDVGADKPFPALQHILGPSPEANPALGLRGIRFHLTHPEFLQQQLRAILLAAADTGAQLWIMFPMISTVEEVMKARDIFTRVQKQMRKERLALPAHVPIGIMVEVPAAALVAAELAEVVDFLSIGSNDLAQYIMAADRTNATVAPLDNPMQPSFLRLVRQVAQAGLHAGKPVAVCGEIAGDPRLAPLLIGLGVNELSMTPTAIPAVRNLLARPIAQDLAQLADRVCRQRTCAEAERVYADWRTSMR